MKEIALAPIRHPIASFEAIEKEILDILRSEIYQPILDEFSLPKKIIKNSIEDVSDAIKSGRLSYSRGAFRGKFGSNVSRELKRMGAVWREGAWHLPYAKVPAEIKAGISGAEATFLQKIARIDKRLQKLLPEKIADLLQIDKIFDTTLYRVNRELTSGMKGITIAPTLTDANRAKIAEEYTNNLKLYIKDWSKKEIVKLRKQVQTQVFEGDRNQSMIRIIRESYGVGERKAKFLARQETNLLLAKFKTERYNDAGVKFYKWRCVVGSPAHPVRPRHQELNDQSLKGRLFRFDDPPTQADGKRKNPGEDYNCRCIAIPVVKF